MFSLIREVCSVIRKLLMPIYSPRINENSWLRITHDYEQLWQLPNCLGALDGRHFGLKKPPHSGSLFYNYRHFFSTVLLATCNAYKRFTWFNLGDFGKFQLFIIHKHVFFYQSISKYFHVLGSVNDASIFNNSDLCKKM